LFPRVASGPTPAQPREGRAYDEAHHLEAGPAAWTTQSHPTPWSNLGRPREESSMPTRLHKPMHEPARLTDRVLAHPWELGAVSGAWTVLGALLCWSWIDPGGGPSTVLNGMSAWVAGAV